MEIKVNETEKRSFEPMLCESTFKVDSDMAKASLTGKHQLTLAKPTGASSYEWLFGKKNAFVMESSRATEFTKTRDVMRNLPVKTGVRFHAGKNWMFRSGASLKDEK